MTDIITEVIRTVLLAMIVVGLVAVSRRRSALAQPGWHLLLGGFVLLLFGCVLDVTDNFESLNHFVVIGDTEVEAILEKLVGFLGGFILLAIGLLRWLPNLTSIDELRQAHHELEDANKRLVCASRAKSEFLANMSHEIRTPMTAILGYVELLDGDETMLRDPRQVKEAIHTIGTNGQHLLTIINDILDMSKIEAGKLDVERITTDPVQIVEEIASLMRPRAIDKGLELIVNYASPIPAKIESDPTRMRQILVNLIGNAVKFTQTGSVTLRASTDTTEQIIRFDVIDTGIGMTPEQLEVIRKFEAFHQADGSTTRNFGGTGLGLRISNTLAQMLGGQITVDSTYGRGSTFSATISTGDLTGVDMCMPEQAASHVAENDPAHKHPADEAGATALQGLKILLAEDGPDNQRLISYHLKKAGAEVTLADNGRIALEQVVQAEQSAPFDVVLMDMQMPELDGYGATRELRKQGIRTPIIALTAHAMDGDRQSCLDAGCVDYLTKPIDKQTVIRTCAEWSKKKLDATA